MYAFRVAFRFLAAFQNTNAVATTLGGTAGLCFRIAIPKGAITMRNGFTVGQIAKALRCHEQSARLYLSEVNRGVDRRANDLGERIDASTVVALYRRYQDSIIGRRLVSLIEGAR